MDIVVAYCESWDTPLRTSKHHFIERLAKKGHRILYVETPPTPLSILKRPVEFFKLKLPRLLKGAQQVKDNIWVMTGMFPLPYHRGFCSVFDHLFFNKINQVFFLRRLKKHLSRLNFKNPSLIVYYPFMLPIIDRIKWRRVLFHIIDEWQGMPGIPNSMAVLTEQMLQKADVTVVTSQRLFDRYAAHSQNIHLLRHGVDMALFQPVVRHEIAEDERLGNISRPRIGYYGALHKLDFAIIRQVSQQLPDYSFILMGPTSGSQGAGLRKNLPANVFFLKPVKHSKLPQFLVGLDVFWLPYLTNDLYHSMCSIKLYEALGAGLPIIVSDLDESRAVVREKGRLAATIAEHVLNLQKALSENDITNRIDRSSFVEQYDWKQRTKIFSGLLLEVDDH